MADVSAMIRRNISSMNERMKLFNTEKKILKNLDLFVLDNSLRQNSVGSTRAHTVENKCKIYNEVKKSGLRHITVASFRHESRSALHFLQYLKKKGEDLTKCFAAVELVDDSNAEKVPQGLFQCKEYGIQNVVLELDLSFRGMDHITADKLCSLLAQSFQWIRQNLSPNSLILVNIRDFTDCMARFPARVLYLIRYLSSLPSSVRVFGMCVEDSGRCRGEELSVWIGTVREEMKSAGWR